jgi:hypothetical protein
MNELSHSGFAAYDRDGVRINWLRYVELLDDPAYRRVALTNLDGGGFISTVWLGVDHGFGRGPPLIFESMSFSVPGEHCERYSTLAEALAGHERMVAAVLTERTSGA